MDTNDWINYAPNKFKIKVGTKWIRIKHSEWDSINGWIVDFDGRFRPLNMPIGVSIYSVKEAALFEVLDMLNRSIKESTELQTEVANIAFRDLREGK